MPMTVGGPIRIMFFPEVVVCLKPLRVISAWMQIALSGVLFYALPFSHFCGPRKVFPLSLCTGNNGHFWAQRSSSRQNVLMWLLAFSKATIFFSLIVTFSSHRHPALRRTFVRWPKNRMLCYFREVSRYGRVPSFLHSNAHLENT